MARPSELNHYFTDIEALPGVGKRTRALYERVAGPRIRDLLFHLPVGLIDRRYRPTIADAVEGSISTIEVQVVKHEPGRSSKAPYKVLVQDKSSFLTLVFFRARSDWLLKQLPEGETRLISGKIERFRGDAQITHPDYMVPLEDADSLPLLEPVYGLTTGLSGKSLRKAIQAGLEGISELPNWMSDDVARKLSVPSFLEALKKAHNPESEADLDPNSDERRRLAYDELLASQLALTIVRQRARRRSGIEIKGDDRHQAKIRSAFGYDLTGDQEQALAEIKSDLASDKAMLRLVQGDVGSGKTIVALLAMAAAVEDGFQAAILAPTEILARQHMATIEPLVGMAGLKVALLTGRNKGKARAQILRELHCGEIDILIGTHAIIQDDVSFSNLGIAVIDEQHRFGVEQRLALGKKAKHAIDLLVMTATPIPRTLTLTAYGDMDVSRIQEKPAGRQPVETVVVSNDRLEQLVGRVGSQLDEGARLYWVCPLVEESEVSDLAAAESRFKALSQLYGDRVGLVHGRMKSKDKDDVMAAFAAGTIQLLVSTTVIEVGVDVPEATIMIIEHAERFGLAQLHQLRGRVGRGRARSTCILLRAEMISDVARDRLKVMRETDDGFKIAEEDLRLRGAGELLGTRQSGMPVMKLADLSAHSDLLQMARDDARHYLAVDTDLSRDRGKALRCLLYLMKQDDGVRMIRSG